jgi:hypothetical protein
MRKRSVCHPAWAAFRPIPVRIRFYDVQQKMSPGKGAVLFESRDIYCLFARDQCYRVPLFSVLSYADTQTACPLAQ